MVDRLGSRSRDLALKRTETEERAKDWLLRQDQRLKKPTAGERSQLTLAFLKVGKKLNQSGFDLIRLKKQFIDSNNSQFNIGNIECLIEVKSTSTYETIDLRGMFFSLTEAEIANAQSLGKRFKFLFVNPGCGIVVEHTLDEIWNRATRRHLRWAVTLGPLNRR